MENLLYQNQSHPEIVAAKDSARFIFVKKVLEIFVVLKAPDMIHDMENQCIIDADCYS